MALLVSYRALGPGNDIVVVCWTTYAYDTRHQGGRDIHIPAPAYVVIWLNKHTQHPLNDANTMSPRKQLTTTWVCDEHLLGGTRTTVRQLMYIISLCHGI